jgi:hypothetical protein
VQYWFVATLANGLLWAQIVIGAALTALGAYVVPSLPLIEFSVAYAFSAHYSTKTANAQTAVIYLGAASTVIAGLLTYFKSRNQPNRARQFRNALRGVRNKIDDKSHELHGLTPEQARAVAAGIIKQYNQALAEAAANYPDLWVTLGDLKRWVPTDDPFPETKEGDDKGKPGLAGTGTGRKPNSLKAQGDGNSIHSQHSAPP